MVNLSKYLFVLLTAIAFGCSRDNENVFHGDLYFSKVRFGNYYNMPDSFRLQLENKLAAFDVSDADSSEHAFVEFFNKLKSEGLLTKPYVDLKLDNDSFVKLYLDSGDYDKIKIYKRLSLQDAHKKVVITATTKNIGTMSVPLLYCEKLISIRLVEGETLPYGSKFSIDDYY